MDTFWYRAVKIYFNKVLTLLHCFKNLGTSFSLEFMKTSHGNHYVFHRYEKQKEIKSFCCWLCIILFSIVF